MEEKISRLFSQSELADDWIQRTIHHFGPWVDRKGKSYWEFVRFYGHRKGVLRQLSRRDYAMLLNVECREGLKSSDTESSLVFSMEKFPYKKELRRRSKEERKKQAMNVEWAFELLPDTHPCRCLMRELDDLCSKPLPATPASDMPTMEQRLKEYLDALAREELYSKVFSSPEYCGCTATISVEQYVKQDFMDHRKPSHIVVYECVEGSVDEQMVMMYSGRYVTDRRIKLYVCSTHGFDLRTQKMASDRNVGLMLINPSYEITSSCYVVPRSIEVHAILEMERETLRGTRSMTTPFIVYDECGITCSLADVLKYHGISVRQDLCLHAPYLTNDYIEEKALELVREKVDEFVRQIRQYPTTRQVPSFDADPDQLLRDAGYTLEETDMSSTGQLAVIDLKKKKVTIDSSQSYKTHRIRYSKSHEFGHGTLHSNLNVAAFGESEATLCSNALNDGREQWWLEHHANHFAACLLMPKDVVGYLYAFYCQKVFGRNVIRKICLGPQQCQQQDFYSIARPMSERMNVSIEALKWRLVNMKLVEIIS